MDAVVVFNLFGESNKKEKKKTIEVVFADKHLVLKKRGVNNISRLCVCVPVFEDCCAIILLFIHTLFGAIRPIIHFGGRRETKRSKATCSAIGIMFDNTSPLSFCFIIIINPTQHW